MNIETKKTLTTVEQEEEKAQMTDVKSCPFLVRMCNMDGQIIGYTCKGACARCPAKDAKDKEIERLKAEVTRYRQAFHSYIVRLKTKD